MYMCVCDLYSANVLVILCVSLLFETLISYNYVASNNKLISQIISYHIIELLQLPIVNNITPFEFIENTFIKIRDFMRK